VSFRLLVVSITRAELSLRGHTGVTGLAGYHSGGTILVVIQYSLVSLHLMIARAGLCDLQELPGTTHHLPYADRAARSSPAEHSWGHHDHLKAETVSPFPHPVVYHSTRINGLPTPWRSSLAVRWLGGWLSLHWIVTNITPT
jgi:hypothetical protein